MQILVVEDERPLSNAIKKILEQKGYFVDAVYDGAEAVDYALAAAYNLIILDVMLPKLDGFEVIRILRKDGIQTPVLMLTARTAVSDKVTGLNEGADDYMTKPFVTEELLARVNALTRRRGEVVVNEMKHGNLSLDLKSGELKSPAASVQLSRKEFELLKTFFYNPTVTMNKDTLITNAWGTDADVSDNNVEVYISFLRKKMKFLKADVTIKNIHKIGYRLGEAE